MSGGKLFRLAVLFCSGISATNLVRAADFFWANARSGPWSTAANWSTGKVPGPTDNAFITLDGTYTVTLDVNAAVNDLTLGAAVGTQTFLINGQTLTLAATGRVNSNGNLVLSAGTLTGPGTLTISNSGTLTWTGGNMTGGGTTSVAPGGQMNIAGIADKSLFHGSQGSGGRKINNAGTVNWTGSGRILGGEGAVFNNQSNGVFVAQNDSSLTYAGFGQSPQFNNAGKLIKNTGTGATVFNSFPLNNSGSVEVQSGTLTLGGGGSSSGEFRAALGSGIDFTAGTHTLNAGASFVGAGLSRVAGGTVTVSDSASVGSVTVTGMFELSAGTLNGGGTFAVGPGSTFNWSGGNLGGGGITLIARGGKMGITGAADKQMFHGSLGNDGHKINNTGTITWTGSGRILGGDGAVINNQPGGLFDAQNDATFTYVGFGNLAAFNNRAGATFRKSGGAGSTTFASFTMNQNGTVEAQTGALAFTSINHFINDGATFTGAGVCRVVNGTVTVSGVATADGVFELAGGTLNGAGELRTLSIFNWTGGNLTGTGTNGVTRGGQMNISGTADKQFYHGGQGSGGRKINNAGTVNWTGSGRILGGDGAVFNNQSNGVFVAQNDASLAYIGFGNSPLFNNAGKLIKNIGTGATVLNSFPLNNSGSVEVQSGSLTLGGGGSSSGEFRTAVGGGMDFTAGTHTLNAGATFVGAGLSRVAGGTVTVSGSASVGSVAEAGTFELSTGTLSGGGTFAVSPSSTLNWSGGNMTGNGTTLIPVGGQLKIGGTADKQMFHGLQGSDGRKISNTGTITWTGSGRILGGDGAVINNQAGGLFDAQNDATLTYVGFGNSSSFNNRAGATFRKSGGTGTTTLASFTMNQNGAVEVQTGTLAFSSVNHFFNDGATFTGAGLSRVVDATATVSGVATVDGVFELAGGTLNGAGEFRTIGTFNWSGGTLTGPGTNSVTGRGRMNISGAGDKGFYHGILGSGGRKIINAGTVNWTGKGHLLGGDGAVFDNQAGSTFIAEPNATFSYIGFGNLPAFNNSGTIHPGGIGSAGVLNFNSVQFNQTSLSVLAIEIGGLTAGAQFDQLKVTGAATLNGTLNVRLINGFSLSGSNQFEIVTYGSRAGTFGSIAGDGGVYTPDYRSTSLVLTGVGTPVPPAEPTLLGPAPYLSKFDSPFINGILSGSIYLEDFETGALNSPGVTVSGGAVFGPSAFTDSVDADDGKIDGRGLAGHSFGISSGAASLTFTFDARVLGSLPTQAGVVWTDGFGLTTFEAFDAKGASLGKIGPVAIATGPPNIQGATDEDRFFGVSHQEGILAIKISNTEGGLEVDHLQYGRAGVSPSADLAIFKTSPTEPATVGNSLAFAIIVTNRGPAIATGVTVTDAVPAGVTLVSIESSRGNCLVTNGALICSLGNLANGASAALFMTVTPTRAGNITNTVTVSGSEPDPNRLNNFAIDTVRVTAAVRPIITGQPQGGSVALGSTVSLQVAATGTPPLLYQWRLNGENIPAATSPTLTIPNFQLADAGAYRVLVANDAGAVRSETAVLAPANLVGLPLTNNFSDRVVVSNLARIGIGSNVAASKETNEPNHAGKTGGKSVWISWLAPATGIATFSTAGSVFDTVLAVYTGDSLVSLSEVDSDDDRGSRFTSQADFNAVAGTRYEIAIDGVLGAEGNIVLGWTLEPTLVARVTFLSQPASLTVGLGDSATFSVVATGAVSAYQWFFNGAPVPGATSSSLTIANVQRANLGRYFVRVSRGPRSVDSRGAHLQINTSAVGTVVERALADDKFADTVQGALRDRRAIRQSVLPAGARRRTSLARGYSGTQIFNTFGSASEQGEPIHCGVVGGASQWFAYQAESDGQLTISTDGSDFDTVLAVYTGSGADFASLESVACDNDSGLDGKDSVVSFSAVAGTIYYMAVDGVNAATGNVQLSYNLVAPPSLQLLSRSGAGFPGLKLSGQPGRSFTIEASTNLIDWVPVRTTNAPTGIFDFLDSGAPGFGQRFYRASMPQ